MHLQLGLVCSADFGTERDSLQKVRELEISGDIMVNITSTGISDDSNAIEVSHLNSGHQKTQDIAMSAAQISVLVNGHFIERPLRNAFINLEETSLVSDVIYEEEETDSEDGLLECCHIINKTNILSQIEPPVKVQTNQEIEKENDVYNIETIVSTIAYVADCIEETNEVKELKDCAHRRF
ncbi:uncharacterized protein [Centruroides vittatus]|uniref:uncharacterized protein n=1 Tax=Centruroides vittatus TaxID=120091 RepID=UPI00350F1B25